MFDLSATEARRAVVALMVSTLLHGLPFVAGRLHLPEFEKGQQIILQATLQPLPANTVTPDPTPEQAVKKLLRPKLVQAPPPRVGKVMTGDSPVSLPLTDVKTIPGTPSETTQEAEAAAPDSAAMIVQDIGAPAYPNEAVRRGLESCVLAAVEVTAVGEVQAVRILHADIPAMFDQSVIDAQRAATYLPARRNGENVASRVLAVVDFVLQPGTNHRCAFRYAAAARMANALPANAEITPDMIGAAVGKP